MENQIEFMDYNSEIEIICDDSIDCEIEEIEPIEIIRYMFEEYYNKQVKRKAEYELCGDYLKKPRYWGVYDDFSMNCS